MKVLVLGATGMLGGYSAIALRKSGHDIVACGRRKSDNGLFVAHGCRYVGGVTLENASSFESLPQDVDAVVHMAGTMPAHADDSPMPYVQSIIVGMVNLLEWMRKGSCRRIVFNTTPSDVCAFFGEAVPVDDDAPRSFPKDGGDHAVYAICKDAAVDILEHYRIAYGFKPIVFRHLTVYGWHPNAGYYVNGVKKILPWRQIVRKCIAAEPVEIWGDPNRKKELLYVDDFTEAVHMAVESDVTGLYNLPGFRPYTLEEQIKGLIGAFCPRGKPSEVVYCPEKTSTPQNLLSGEKVRRALGWQPRNTWEDACIKMRNASIANELCLMWGDLEDADRYKG